MREADGEWAKIDSVLCLDTDTAARAEVLARARRHGTKCAEFVPYDFGADDIEKAVGADAYVMLQYTRGKTGLRGAYDPLLQDRLARLRDGGVTAPIVVGIGLSTPDQARDAVSKGADGIVTGSKTLMMAEESRAALEDYLSEMRSALDHG